MTMELRLKNYQSWSQASVSLDGLTILVGSSGLGKSCFGRALKRCLRNDVPTSHIKLGTPKVELDLNWRGLVLHVERGAKAKDSTVYTVNGQTYEKLGGSVPMEVTAMNFGPVEVNGVSIDPLFAGQFDSQFMVGATPAELNAVLKAFASTEKLDRGRKVLAGRVADINAQAKALTPIVSGLEEQQANLQGVLDASYDDMALVQSLAVKVQRLQRAKDLQCIALMGMVTAQIHQEKVDQITVLGDRLQVAVTTAKSTIRAFAARSARLTYERLLDHLQEVQGVGFLQADLNKLSRAAGSHKVLTVATAKQGTFQAQLTKLEAVTAPLNTCLIRYKALVRVRSYTDADPETPRRKAQMIHALNVAAPSKMLSAAIILGKRSFACELQDTGTKALLDVNQDLRRIQDEQQDLETQITEARLAGALVTCPKCKTEFTPDHTH